MRRKIYPRPTKVRKSTLGGLRRRESAQNRVLKSPWNKDFTDTLNMTKVQWLLQRTRVRPSFFVREWTCQRAIFLFVKRTRSVSLMCALAWPLLRFFCKNGLDRLPMAVVDQDKTCACVEHEFYGPHGVADFFMIICQNSHNDSGFWQFRPKLTYFKKISATPKPSSYLPKIAPECLFWPVTSFRNRSELQINQGPP